MGFLNWLKSSNRDESPSQREKPITWDPNTLTMQQPAIPAAPTTEPVVAQQPVRSILDVMRCIYSNFGYCC